MDIFGGAKKLGFGLMRLPLTDANNDAKVDLKATQQMVDAYIENGFSYFDSAWMYHSFESENVAREVLTKRHSRDSFTMATKLHAGFIKTKEDRDRTFDEQCRKTGLDFFDYYLLHDMGEDHYRIYNELDCFKWLQDKKRDGAVRHIGFSYHDNADFLDKVLTEHPEIEFVQMQLNYLDWENSAIQSHRCHDVAAKHGKPVIVMEPVKGGTLARVPAEAETILKAYAPERSIASWALRFAASQSNVRIVLSGMSNMEQLNDNIGFMRDFEPLNAEENALIAQVTDIIGKSIAVPCTGCSYCTDGCPMHIAIPKYFSLYNAEKQLAPNLASPNHSYYERLALTFGMASRCVECGQCESVCPQHLPIIRYLEDVALQFENWGKK